MKLETKFEINDKVYFIRENKIGKGTVNGIEIYISKPKKKAETDVKYHVWNGSSMAVLPASKIFTTIEELTASLVGEYEKGAKR